MNSKLREALNELLGVFNGGLVEYAKWCNNSDIAQIQCVIDKANAALAEPLLNCDVGTAAEQGARAMKAYNYWRNRFSGMSLINAVMAWSQMPYEEGGAK